MGLRTFIAKRIIYSFFLLFFVITLNFIIFALMPGNPLMAYAGAMKLEDPEQAKQLLKQWGLLDPLHVRYIKYVQNMLTWNFGRSSSGRAVATEIMQRLPNTLLLMGTVAIFSMLIGVILGVIAAAKRGGLFDSIAVVGSLTTYSLPSFWMGMLALILFSFTLGWFPSGNTFPDEWLYDWPQPLWQGAILGVQIVIPGLTEILGRLHHLFLPAAVLTLFSYGGWLLLTRASMLENLTDDYVLTARAKGVNERAVLFKHVLKNASLPLITSAALSFAFLISGAILTETIFTWPGLGTWIWLAITIPDHPSIQAFFYIIAVLVIIANFAADILYGVIDPRIKYG